MSLCGSLQQPANLPTGRSFCERRGQWQGKVTETRPQRAREAAVWADCCLAGSEGVLEISQQGVEEMPPDGAGSPGTCPQSQVGVGEPRERREQAER